MFADTPVPGGYEAPKWVIGSNELSGNSDLDIAGAVTGKIEPPEPGSDYYRLSLELRDPDGGELLRIVRNHLRIGVGRFDIRYKDSKEHGGVIEILSAKGQLILDLRLRSSEFVDIQYLHALGDRGWVFVKDGNLHHVSGSQPARRGLGEYPRERRGAGRPRAGLVFENCRNVLIVNARSSNMEAGIVSLGSNNIVVRDFHTENVVDPIIFE